MISRQEHEQLVTAEYLEELRSENARLLRITEEDHVEKEALRAEISQLKSTPIILKGIGKIDGDGWKDTTKKGEVVYVWNTECPVPYKPGQFPRVGYLSWTSSTDQYDFEPASTEELNTWLSNIRNELCSELARFHHSAKAIHYPECWDTVNYPTLDSALSEVFTSFKCSGNHGL